MNRPRIAEKAEKLFRVWRAAGRSAALKMVRAGLADLVRPPFWMRIRYRQFVLARRHEAPADPLSFLWIDPETIVWHRRAFVPKLDLGRVAGGDWDAKILRYEDLPKHKALRARIEHGTPWEETGIYEYLEELIERHEHAIDGCRTREDMVRRYQAIEELIESIQKNGYRPNLDVREDGRAKEAALDQIFVNIGREGDLIFNGGGHHRLSLAKIFGISPVPVLVIVRHEKWQAKRDRIARSGWSGLEKYRTHPDLADLAADLSRVVGDPDTAPTSAK